MTELFNKIKKQSIGVSILCIILGVLFCIWPGSILMIVCRIVGIALIVGGAVLIILAIKAHELLMRSIRIVPGIVCIIFGIWILAKPNGLAYLIPIIIGVLLLYHGVKNMIVCFETKSGDGKRFLPGFIVAVLMIVLGLLLVFYTRIAITIGVIFVGIALIFDGVANLCMLAMASAAEKEKVVDVEISEED